MPVWLAVAGVRCRAVFSPEYRLGRAGLDKDGASHQWLKQSHCVAASHARTDPARSQGRQDASHEDCTPHTTPRMIPSMSGKGHCCDTAMSETGFNTIKAALTWCIALQRREGLIKAISADRVIAVIIPSPLGSGGSSANCIRANETTIKRGGSSLIKGKSSARQRWYRYKPMCS